MRTAMKRAVGGLVLLGGAVVLRPGTQANKVVCRQLEVAARRLRYLGGRMQGASYQLRGRRPDPDVVDNVLADRVRSTLGSVEKRLDLPHIHVMVEDHVVLLHGEVGKEQEARELEQAASEVSGVAGVESYLHVGLTAGDTRPSAGRAVKRPSPALRRLVDTAVDAGVDPAAARVVVRGILATFADRLPLGERDQVASHLPADVRAMFVPPRRSHDAGTPRNVHDLVARIASTTAELPQDKAEEVTVAVIQTLRSLVPEEDRDVSAVLPAELRPLWRSKAA